MCGVSVPLDGRRGNMRSEGTDVVGGNVVAVGRGGRGWPPAPPRRAAQNGERFQVLCVGGFHGSAFSARWLVYSPQTGSCDDELHELEPVDLSGFRGSARSALRLGRGQGDNYQPPTPHTTYTHTHTHTGQIAQITKSRIHSTHDMGFTRHHHGGMGCNLRCGVGRG